MQRETDADEAQHRQRNLEMIFLHVTDEEMMAEMVRRRRLTSVQATMAFYNEYASDDRYMEHIDRDICGLLARGIYTQGLLTFDNHQRGEELPVTYRVGHMFVWRAEK